MTQVGTSNRIERDPLELNVEVKNLNGEKMELGDFSQLAMNYVNRPGYCRQALRVIGDHIGVFNSGLDRIADVGAGTGKLTLDLASLGLRSIVAVEPNEEMRKAGISATSQLGIEWLNGSGENTTLSDSSISWVLMGSSFHWVKTEEGLSEFYRILRPGGWFTALWNPRDLERSPFHLELEDRIKVLVPNIRRKSSGVGEFTSDLDQRLTASGRFSSCFFVETRYEIKMSRERYLGAWHSVNDIQAQAGIQKWGEIIKLIEDYTEGLSEISVPYRTRAWTVRRVN